MEKKTEKKTGWFRRRPKKGKPTQNKSTTPRKHSNHQGPLTGKKLRIIPLGGLDEVGKNIMVIEYGNDIVLVDVGMSFAGAEMMGVDYIVPNVSYLEERKRNVKAIFLTHGHLDHIGAIQYVLPKLGNPPIYGSKLTMGLVRERLKEFKLDKTAKLNVVTEDDRIKAGQFEACFFRVNHSIPDSMGVYIKSPEGNVMHTGDFKFDHTPAIDKPTDFQRLAEIGREGVDALLIESTNALKPGFCKSEAEIAKNLESIIRDTKGRLIIASFSSLIGRLNQIIQFAGKYNRKVFLSGRSMVNNLKLSEELGYAQYPKGTVRKITPAVNSMPPSQVLILTTGAQGESLSALTRMSIGEHSQVKIREGDTVVISASPIPGNEKSVVSMVNNLYGKGAKVITNNDIDIHVSGHAHQEELKMMYGLVKPRAYVPIHGEPYMRIGHIELIKSVAEPSMITSFLMNGDVLEINRQGIRKSKQKVPADDILVDGTGFGNIGSRVMEDRKIMAEDGVLVMLFNTYEETKRLISEPDIISRGFLYVKESEEIAHEIKQVAKKAYEHIVQNNKNIPLKELKFQLDNKISTFIRKRLGREPIIIPIIMHV